MAHDVMVLLKSGPITHKALADHLAAGLRGDSAWTLARNSQGDSFYLASDRRGGRSNGSMQFSYDEATGQVHARDIAGVASQPAQFLAGIGAARSPGESGVTAASPAR